MGTEYACAEPESRLKCRRARDETTDSAEEVGGEEVAAGDHHKDVVDILRIAGHVAAVVTASVIEKTRAPHHAIEFAGIHAVVLVHQATANMTIKERKKKSIRT